MCVCGGYVKVCDCYSANYLGKIIHKSSTKSCHRYNLFENSTTGGETPELLKKKTTKKKQTKESCRHGAEKNIIRSFGFLSIYEYNYENL